jgi:hypothetical protein
MLCYVRVEVHHGDEAEGTYNHAAMISYEPAGGAFLAAWKNGACVPRPNLSAAPCRVAASCGA